MHAISVRCAERVDPLHILEAFKFGIDRVVVISCASQDCHYVFGSALAEKNSQQVEDWLHAVGMDPTCLERKESATGDSEGLSHVLMNVVHTLDSTSA